MTETPLFAQAVIGYRAWIADAEDRLWPLHSDRRPWVPGVNTARCECDWDDHALSSRRLVWAADRSGRRTFMGAPEHLAPAGGCACGLYSWRTPRAAWAERGRLPRVVGAVASWGAIEVHDGGFRAEHACAVVFACVDEQDTERLTRIAATYRADLVPLAELTTAARRHGAPLPDTLRPPAELPTASPAELPPPRLVVPAPDATPDDVPPAAAIGFDGRPLASHRRLRYTAGDLGGYC